MSLGDVRRIFLKYDLDGDGYIKYGEFLKLVNFSSSSSGGGGSSSTSRDRDTDRDRDNINTRSSSIDALLDRIRRRLEDNLGSSANSARRIKETFADIDTDQSNGLSKRELSKAFQVLRVEVSVEELGLLFGRFDRDGSGEIDYMEFLKMLNFHMAGGSSRPGVVESKY